jgi:hypothetical protein
MTVGRYATLSNLTPDGLTLVPRLPREQTPRNCTRQGQHEHGELEPRGWQAPVSCMGLGPSVAEGGRQCRVYMGIVSACITVHARWRRGHKGIRSILICHNIKL